MNNTNNNPRFRRATQYESERIVRFLEREYRSYRIPVTFWSWFMGIVGTMSVLSVLTDRNLFEKAVSFLVGVGFCIGCGVLAKSKRTRKNQLENIKKGQFEVLDCRIAEVENYRGGMGTVHVIDESGTFRREWLKSDGVTIKRYINGENPAVLLMRYSGDQYALLTEHRLGG